MKSRCYPAPCPYLMPTEEIETRFGWGGGGSGPFMPSVLHCYPPGALPLRAPTSHHRSLRNHRCVCGMGLLCHCAVLVSGIRDSVAPSEQRIYPFTSFKKRMTAVVNQVLAPSARPPPCRAVRAVCRGPAAPELPFPAAGAAQFTPFESPPPPPQRLSFLLKHTTTASCAQSLVSSARPHRVPHRSPRPHYPVDDVRWGGGIGGAEGHEPHAASTGTPRTPGGEPFVGGLPPRTLPCTLMHRRGTNQSQKAQQVRHRLEPCLHCGGVFGVRGVRSATPCFNFHGGTFADSAPCGGVRRRNTGPCTNEGEVCGRKPCFLATT